MIATTMMTLPDELPLEPEFLDSAVKTLSIAALEWIECWQKAGSPEITRDMDDPRPPAWIGVRISQHGVIDWIVWMCQLELDAGRECGIDNRLFAMLQPLLKFKG